MKIIRKSALSEHLQLAIWGITIGSAAAILGIAPALFGGGADKREVGFSLVLSCINLAGFYLGLPRRFLDLA